MNMNMFFSINDEQTQGSMERNKIRLKTRESAFLFTRGYLS